MAENNTAILVLGLALVVLITAGLTYFATQSVLSGPVNGTNLTSGHPTITVRGEATKTLPPDLLTIGITVEGNGSSVADSQKDAADKISRLKSALLANGVKESDIQTSSYYTSPTYNSSCNKCYPRPIPYAYGTEGSPTPAPQPDIPTDAAYPVQPYPYCEPSICPPTGYQTVHSLTIKSDDTSKGGSLVDSALGVDGARFDYVYFSLKDSTRLAADDELQGSAASAARSKAMKIADGAGVKLGKVVSINTDQYYPPYPVYAGGGAMPQAADAGSARPTEIFPTDTTLSSSIVVVYELEQ